MASLDLLVSNGYRLEAVLTYSLRKIYALREFILVRRNEETARMAVAFRQAQSGDAREFKKFIASLEDKHGVIS